MKKVFFLTLTVLLSVSSFSQSFDASKLRAGGGLFFVSDINNVGLTVNGAYEINAQWEAAIAFTHIFEKDYVKWNMLDFDAHYNFYQHNDKLNVYGLAGLGLTFWKVTIPAMDFGYGFSTPEMTENGTDVGFNIGVGANYKLTDKLNLAPEARFTVAEGSFFRVGATLQYMF
ncbi:MAG: outer membrane beta-barrel protein [Bacteroidota bacterium]